MKTISKLIILFVLAAICPSTLRAIPADALMPRSGVSSFNPDWRFHRGDVPGAEAVSFDDSQWEIVSTPHTVQLMPAEASGCRNYQGVAWYRKHFVAPAGPVTELMFEAVMGRQRFYVNGQLVREHEGGYLPVTINLTEAGVKPGDNVVVAVMADNSDDKTYPPGKKQMTLDFCYHGGIYRDVWMRQRPQVYITDAVEENRTAAGGIFVHYADISQKSAGVYVNTDIRNGLSVPSRVTVTNILTDAAGRIVKKWVKKSVVPAHGFITLTQGSAISHPQLWSPEHPYLYTLHTTVSSAAGVDKATTRIGIRSFEFRGKEGFWLNGSRYRQFVGANRHQDFA